MLKLTGNALRAVKGKYNYQYNDKYAVMTDMLYGPYSPWMMCSIRHLQPQACTGSTILGLPNGYACGRGLQTLAGALAASATASMFLAIALTAFFSCVTEV